MQDVTQDQRDAGKTPRADDIDEKSNVSFDTLGENHVLFWRGRVVPWPGRGAV